MQSRYKSRDAALIQRESSGPEDHLRQLSLFEDAEGLTNNSYKVNFRNIKKVSIIEGWIKQAPRQSPQIKTSPLRSYRKILKQPHPNSSRTHLNQTALAPKHTSIDNLQLEGEAAHHSTRRNKGRPLSSIIHHKNDYTPHSSFQSLPIKKANYNFLRKKSGIKNSKKGVEKDRKMALQLFAYPLLDREIDLNPEKQTAKMGRMSEWGKLKRGLFKL